MNCIMLVKFSWNSIRHTDGKWIPLQTHNVRSSAGQISAEAPYIDSKYLDTFLSYRRLLLNLKTQIPFTLKEWETL